MVLGFRAPQVQGSSRAFWGSRSLGFLILEPGFRVRV